MFFRRRPPGPDTLPQPILDERLYVVGDVHGCDQLLEQLLGVIDKDFYAEPTERAVRLVFVGDYVDRGERSRQVLDRLIELCRDPKLQVSCLKGNHEELLLGFLFDPVKHAGWLDHGGLETLASYGVPAPLRRRRERDFSGLAEDLGQRLGAHKAFLESLSLCFSLGNVFVSHAGVSPDRPLSGQQPDALLWGDDRFLKLGGPPEHVVVHGHWAGDSVDWGVNRVCIDTGAYLSRQLTALRIDAETGYRVLCT